MSTTTPPPTTIRRPTTTASWVPAVLLPIAVVAVALLAQGRASSLAVGLLDGLRWGAVMVAVLAALVLLGRPRPPSPAAADGRPRAVVVGGFFVLLTAVTYGIPDVAGLGRWEAKLLDLLWLAILFAMLRRWAVEEAGVGLRLRRGSAWPVLLVVAAVFLLFAGLALLSVTAGWMPAEQVGVERIAYNATVPNLVEELLWRGALLAVLDRALGTPVTVFGAPMGMGVVVTAVVFGLGHGIVPGAGLGWEVNVAGGVFAVVMGLLLGWARARSGSVWPAFLLHCAPELGVDVGQLLGVS